MFISFIIVFCTLFFNILSVLLNRFSMLGKYLKIILLGINIFSFIFMGFIIVYCIMPSDFNHPNMYKNVFSILVMYILMLLNTLLFRIIYKNNIISLITNIIILFISLFYFILHWSHKEIENSLDSEMPAPISDIIFNIIMSFLFILFISKGRK